MYYHLCILTLITSLALTALSCSPTYTTAASALQTESYELTNQVFAKLVRASVERLLVKGTTSTAPVFFHHNHLHTANVASGQVGMIHGRAAYTPYGREQAKIGYVDVYGFNGEELDPSTGLQRFMFRYYDRDSTRWMSPDPKFTVATTKNMSQLGESTTSYAYVSGNPVKFADPTGLGKKMNAMDLHHKSGVHATQGKTNSTKNFKRLKGNRRVREAAYMADSDIVITHSSNSGSTLSVSEYQSGEKVKVHKSPKEFADQMTEAGWDKDVLVLAACNTGYEDVTYNGDTTSYGAHLAKELSANLGGKAVTVIAPEATVGVTKDGNFYTKDSTLKVDDKPTKADKAAYNKSSTTGIGRWKEATSTGGNKATIAPMSQDTADSISGFN